MAYLTQVELERLNFKHLGKDVKISDRASLDKCHLMSIGDQSRIDDFCAVSGAVNIGRNVHIAVHCSITASHDAVTLGDFSGLAFACHVFSSSDDYSGESLTNPTIPTKFKQIISAPVVIGKHTIVGAGSIIFPGVNLGEGTSIGAGAIVTKSTEPWGIYVGSPARRVKERSKKLLELENEFLRDFPYEED